MRENNEEEEEIENTKKQGIEDLENEIAENHKWEDQFQEKCAAFKER